MKRVAALATLLGLSASRPCEAQPAAASAPTSSASSAEPSDDITLPPGVSAHVLQTLAAAALELGSGTIWYIADDRNVLDWDRPSLRSRLTGESWRYDNNSFWMNFAGHPLFGSGVYAVARDSHSGVFFSFLASFLTSMAWEFGIEYNERVSINDVLFTPVTGVALGEFSHKLGFYLSSHAKGSAGRTALSWALTPLTQASHFTCAGEPTRGYPADSLGYTSGMWHEFYADYGISGVRATGAPEALLQQLRTGGSFAALPNHRSPGRSSRGFWSAEISRLRLALEKSSLGAGVSLVTDTTLAGYAWRELSSNGAGHSHAVGIAVGYGYENSHAAGLDERKSWVGFPGIALDSYWSSPRLTSEWSLRAYPVFGGASSPAFPLYREHTPNQTFKTVLNRAGYFYGFGLVGELQARQRFGILENQFSLRAEPLWSSEGLDRDQAKVTDDTKARDLILGVSLRTSLSLGYSAVLGLEASSQVRESRAGDVRLSQRRQSFGLWLGARF